MLLVRVIDHLCCWKVLRLVRVRCTWIMRINIRCYLLLVKVIYWCSWITVLINMVDIAAGTLVEQGAYQCP